jgi:16S rRNA (guanine527-N7)-methyltransferase
MVFPVKHHSGAPGPRVTAKPTDKPQDYAEARRDLAAALLRLDLALDPAQIETLLALAALLEAWGARINLTGHKTFRAIVQGMVIESVALASQLPAVRSLADLGSGAGFPGLPIAILRPQCRVTLVDARERRHHFQRAAIRELGLENVSAIRGRAETLSPSPHAAAIAQAMAQPERALTWMLPWVEGGGLVVIPGSETPPTIEPLGGVAFEASLHYRVPISNRSRSLWFGRAPI